MIEVYNILAIYARAENRTAFKHGNALNGKKNAKNQSSSNDSCTSSSLGSATFFSVFFLTKSGSSS